MNIHICHRCGTPSGGMTFNPKQLCDDCMTDSEQQELEYSKPPETLSKRIKRRLPSVKGLAEFWSPTKCECCYWMRLALAAAAGYFLGPWVIYLFLAISFYYAARK